MPATKPVDELRRKAAALIIERTKKIGVAKAASELRVSRQALYDIMSGKYCPSLGLIQRACAAWGLEFTFRGLQVSQKTLRSNQLPSNQPAQTTIVFDALELLEKQSLESVKAKRIGKTVELLFRFRVPA